MIDIWALRGIGWEGGPWVGTQYHSSTFWLQQDNTA